MQEFYRHDIDGLRAVAVILVIVFHAFPQLLPGGYIGVDVFFVISGFVITSKIANDIRADHFTYRDFYAKRLRRLLPALVVVLAASLAIGSVLLPPGQLSALAEQAIASLLFVPNILFWSQTGYFDAAAETKPLLHLWSLGVEEQFYLVWPLLLTLIGVRIPKRIVVTLAMLIGASFAYSIYGSHHYPTAAYYSPLSRFWQLGCGGLLVFLPRLSRRFETASLLGLALIVSSALFLSRTSVFPGMNAVPAVIGASSVIAFGSRLLANPVAIFVGRISYPLYLWHLPLLVFAKLEGATSSSAKLCIIILSVLLGAATTYFVEGPIRQRSQIFPWLARRAAPAIGISITGVLAIAIFVFSSGGGISLYAKQIQPVLRLMTYPPAMDARSPQCWLPNAEPFSSYADECFRGDTLIWGDSHAARLYSGYARNSIAIAQLTRNSCWPVLESHYPLCADGNEKVLQVILHRKPRRVILYAAWLNYSSSSVIDPPNVERLTKTLNLLGRSGAEIVLLGPAPIWSDSLPNIVYDHWRKTGELPDRLQPRPHDYAAADDLLRQAAISSGAKFVSVYDVLCNDTGCLTHTSLSHSELWTWDYGHLTTEGADFLLRQLSLK